MANVATAKEAKDRLSRIGKTTVDVARDLGVPVTTVRGVLSGKLSGVRGDAHKVAVTLGMKEGVIVDAKLPLAEAMQVAAAL